MRIILASSFVPFINGGYRFIVEWLEEKLTEYGHQVERFYLPFVDRAEDLFDQILSFRLIDLSASCDRLITFRPPAHVLPHPNKVVWFIHHIRTMYDLWDSPYRMVEDNPLGRAIRQRLFDLDTTTLMQSRRVFTNSRTVANRLLQFNGVSATPLYPPLSNPDRFRNDRYGDEILVVCRVEAHKRQLLLVEAMRHVKSAVKLRLCGTGMSTEYLAAIRRTIASDLGERVIFENSWISEDRKIELLASALAVAYLPMDEDSYGYPTLEAALSCKGAITTADSGGVLEFVQHGVNGIVAEPDAVSLADAMDRLYCDRALAARMGAMSMKRVEELQINWPRVVESLIA
jgi:glycosyltransferase involved in cell wall biosynthesis